MLEVHQFTCLADNYGYLVHDPNSNLTATIDTPDVDAINQALAQKGWTLTHILNTHHHFDHAGGNIELKNKWQCTIVGSKTDQDRIPGIDITLEDGDNYQLGEHSISILEVSGHTIGHIAFYFDKSKYLFCGDALFSLGCGRLFEGKPAQMWESLCKITQLADETLVYCAHEYTQANAKFAMSIEPGNPLLVARTNDITKLRAEARPTVPTTLALEKATNPFLRPHSMEIQRHIGLESGSELDVFTALRKLKDNF